WLTERVVFLADEEGQDAGAVAPGRPMFRKGQDFAALAAVLRQIARLARGGAASRMGNKWGPARRPAVSPRRAPPVLWDPAGAICYAASPRLRWWVARRPP